MSFRRMKKMAAILLAAALLLLPYACTGESGEDGEDRVRELCDFLQGHYGIGVLTGEECLFIPRDNIEIQLNYSEVSDTGEAVFKSSRYEELLMLLDDVLSVYPPSFFSRFAPQDGDEPGGLRFLLVDRLYYGGSPDSGMFYHAGGGWMDIWLSASGARERTIHHEIGHALEYLIRMEDPEAFSDWESLNPEGFEYGEDAASEDGAERDREPEDWFVREYSKHDVWEDRATVFEAIMLKDAEWWEARPHLQKKAEVLQRYVDLP